MEYDDEKIIQQRLALSAEKRHSIFNKVKIDGVEYTFARREFEFGFTMVVPESFETMPHEIAKRKFPYEDRPAIIISNIDSRICVAFNNTEPQNESLEQRLSNFRAYIKRICPTSVFFSHGITVLDNGLNVAHYDYRYPVVDNDIYDLTFFVDLPDIELLGWFICPIEDKDKWEPLATQMIQSIQISEEVV